MKKQLSQLKPTVDLVEKTDLKSLKAGFDPENQASTSDATQGSSSTGGTAGYDSCVCACAC